MWFWFWFDGLVGGAEICGGGYVLVVAIFFYLLWPVLEFEGERDEKEEKKRNSKKKGIKKNI